MIRKSTSPLASLIVLVLKKNGKVRTCIDYRKLNSVTRKDTFHLPRIQDCIDALAGSSWISTFELISGYYQVPIKAADIQKTAFMTSKNGLWEFVSLQMGLTCATDTATFQRLMELALQGLG